MLRDTLFLAMGLGLLVVGLNWLKYCAAML